MAKKPGEPAGDGTAKKGKGKLIIILVVVLLLLGGGGFFAVYQFTDIITGPKEEVVATATPTPTPPKKVEELDAITVNLANGSGFLKLKLAVSMDPEKYPDALVKAPVYDEALKLYSRLSLQQLQDPAVREAAKVQLLDKLRGIYGKDAILEVYYTEFVTQ